MKAVWLVRVRELRSRMRFWTSIVGYDPRDHSLRQTIYLIYVAAFFSVWGFAVLALLANFGAGLLALVGVYSPSMVSVAIIAMLLIIDFAIRGYRSGKTSPYIFSDVDTEQICQTPVDRRFVALGWFLVDWFPTGVLLGALAMILKLASVQLIESDAVVWAQIPRFMLVGLQAASISLLLSLAMVALDYALGALRLLGSKDILWLRWIPVGVLGLGIATTLLGEGSTAKLWWPILFPLEAGFGEASWMGGFIISVILALGGLIAIYLASPRLNLSRAAQESHYRWILQQGGLFGSSQLAQQIRIRQRLGSGHAASRIPGRAGVLALIWKDWVITLRTINFSLLVKWLSLSSISMVMILIPDWGVRVWAFIIWCLLIGQQCTQRLRGDLEVWGISRQLPFPLQQLLVADLATQVIAAILVIMVFIGISSVLGFSPQFFLVLMLPLQVISIALVASFDILRQCRSSELLAGQVAEFGAGGLILGIILAGFPLGVLFWFTNKFTAPGLIGLFFLFTLLLNLAIIYVLWKLTGRIYQEIK